jgi:glycosyltransferase involved in cell wall biosynthesis
MPNSELVSVVIPVYNAGRFLADAIRSVFAQSHAQIQIIVVDDGSTDHSADVVRHFAVGYIRQQHSGIAAARNTGVLAARGSLLAFLDADDLWTHNRLARQVQLLAQRPDVQLAAGRVEQFYDESYTGPRNPLPAPAAEAYTAGALLIRRRDFFRVGMFNTRLQVGEFIDWHSRAINTGFREFCLNEVLLRRRIHGENSTLKQRHSQRDYLSVVKSHLDRKRRTA